MAGYNLPDGVLESSKTAPWNHADPWSGRTCGECRRAVDCRMLDRTERLVCVDPLGFGADEVDAGAPACEEFE